MNPFLITESPKFDESLESSIISTPNQSSFFDSSISAVFLEDENEEPSFAMDEVEQRLKNPVNFTAQKNRTVPTPIEYRVLLQEKCSKFFQNKTPSPASPPSQPLLLDTPSTDSINRLRTPSMAEQFAVFLKDHGNTSSVSGCTPRDEGNMSDCTPGKAETIQFSSRKELKDPSTLEESPQIPICSPVLTSPIVKYSPGLSNSMVKCSPGLGSPIFECLQEKPQSGETVNKGHSQENTSRVRQRLQWTRSPPVKRRRLVRKLKNKQQIIKMTKVVSS